MFRLTNRLILFFSIIMLVLGVTWYIGNLNEYDDLTLRIIVSLDLLFALIQAVLIAYALVFMVIAIFRRKSAKPLLYIFHYMAAGLIAAASLALSSVINYLMFH